MALKISATLRSVTFRDGDIIFVRVSEYSFGAITNKRDMPKRKRFGDRNGLGQIYYLEIKGVI